MKYQHGGASPVPLTEQRLKVLLADLDRRRRRRSIAPPTVVEYSINTLLGIYGKFFENDFQWIGPLPPIGDTRAVRQEMAAGAVMLLLHFCECGFGLAAEVAEICPNQFPSHGMSAYEHSATITFANELVKDFKRQIRLFGDFESSRISTSLH